MIFIIHRSTWYHTLFFYIITYPVPFLFPKCSIHFDILQIQRLELSHLIFINSKSVASISPVIFRFFSFV